MLRSLRKFAAALALLMSFHEVHALNSRIKLEDLNHASWSEKDGMPSEIASMAQTPDGWLWLGTTDGLFRFDGVNFERVPVPKPQIGNLTALSNGDLLISFPLEGLMVLSPDGTMKEITGSFTHEIESASRMDADQEGAIWVASNKGLFRLLKGKWENIFSTTDWGEQVSLLIDQYDRVWFATNKSLYHYDRATSKLIEVPGTGMHGDLIQSPDGRIWAISNGTFYPVAAPRAGTVLPRQADFNYRQSRVAGQFDRDGNLWVPQCPRGLCRVARAAQLPNKPFNVAHIATEKLDQGWQLSALPALLTMEDREGNIWIITQSGLDRFRENKLQPSHIPTPSGISTMATDTEGRILVAEEQNRRLWLLREDGPPQLLRSDISALANDRDGAVLLAGTRNIERIYKGKTSLIPLPMPGGKPTDHFVIGIRDDGRVLWMVSNKTGLVGWIDGQWRSRSSFNLPPRIALSATGRPGQLWLSQNDGALSFYDHDKLTRYDSSAVGQESGIFPGPQIVVSGDRGMAVLRGQKFEPLKAPNADVLRNVTGMAITADGDRWFNGMRGIVHVRRDDWEASMRQPSTPLVYEVIDALEGYPGRAVMTNRQSTIYDAGNGQLWLRATGGLLKLDTTTLHPSHVKPTTRLLRVNTDTKSYPASALLQLPPNSSNFNIQYSAPGLRKPEAIRFQYQLQGVDHQWVDAGTRRAAYYNNIAPGRYVFNARAVNEDGIISDAVATMQLEIAPTITQTWWFRLGCAIIALLILYGLYKYRLKTATNAITRQLLVRLDERERIARTLHDTFLQSVQALILNVHTVCFKLPEGSEPRTRLENVLQNADHAIIEGRRQVQQLRNDLHIDRFFQRAGDLLASMYANTRFVLTVVSKPRELTPAAHEDLCAIGQEALQNAFRHAQAQLVTASVEFHPDYFVLRIDDNGCGIDEGEMLSRVKQQHWGLVGMRERAQHIGADFSITTAPGKGTRVELKIAAQVAYQT